VNYAKPKTIDLSGRELIGRDFSKVCLTDSNFMGADLNGAKFSKSVLDRCFFSESNLYLAEFGAAQLIGCEFYESVLKYADFHLAQIEDCEFFGVDMRDTTLGFVHSRVYSDLARFKGCSFIDVDLSGKDLRNFVFDGCVFERVAMKNCKLEGSVFKNCALAMVDITGATLKDATKSPRYRVIKEVVADCALRAEDLEGL